MANLTLDLIKTLFLRFSTIFGEKFYKFYQSDEMFDMWCQDWLEGLAGVQPEHIKLALEHCKLNLQWSPSIAEFRNICDRYAGIPSINEVIALAIRGDFTHPLVQVIYDKVGSWDMKHMNERDLLKRVSEIYREEIANVRMNQYRQFKIETDKKITELKGISDDDTNGSGNKPRIGDMPADQAAVLPQSTLGGSGEESSKRSNDMQKASDLVFPRRANG